jgi:hypothetical protein
MKLKQLSLYLESQSDCPFDVIFLSRRDSFKSAYSILADKCCQPISSEEDGDSSSTSLTTVVNPLVSKEEKEEEGGGGNLVVDGETSSSTSSSQQGPGIVSASYKNNKNSAIIVFDTVDLHFLREKREAVYNKMYKNSQQSIFGSAGMFFFQEVTIKIPEEIPLPLLSLRLLSFTYLYVYIYVYLKKSQITRRDETAKGTELESSSNGWGRH